MHPISAKLLIIEDDHEAGELLKRTLAGGGFDITLVTTGKDGFDYLDTTKYDLIIADYLLPDMTGRELFEIVQRRFKKTIATICIATEHKVQEAKENLYGLVDDILQKPLNIRKLIDSVRQNILQNIQRQQRHNLTYQPPFQIVHDLMPNRIQTILLVSSPYDYFVLEEDGQLNERIMAVYLNMNFRFAVPRIIHAGSGKEAFHKLHHHDDTRQQFDLVIMMGQVEDVDPGTFSQKLKEKYPKLPIVMMISTIAEYDRYHKSGGLQKVDQVFFWSGDSAIFLTVFKHFEDRQNIDNDLEKGKVRVIIVVEDSVRYYSLFLPMIYNEVFKQTRALIQSGANELEKLLQMRVRPKILLAKTYEEAIELFQKYEFNLLGVISDINFPKNGKKHPEAGLKLIEEIRRVNPYIPVALQSAEPDNETHARRLNVAFINKNSPELLKKISRFLQQNFGFGDFVFRSPRGEEVGRAEDMDSMIKTFAEMPLESIEYHARHNHFSHWFFARGEFTLAEQLRPQRMEDFDDIEEMRQYLLKLMRQTRSEKHDAAISAFIKDRFDTERGFFKIGNGSIGGKARSLAYLSAIFNRQRMQQLFENVHIFVPATVVIATDQFDKFLEENKLKTFAIEENSNNLILARFEDAKLPEDLEKALRIVIEQINKPLAVRSSSLLEDSRYQPFAGIYTTYMLPNNHPDSEVRYQQLASAIKHIYASTYFSSTKAYLEGTPFRIEEEKMGIVLQKLVGRAYNQRFYPNFSGVAQSYNFYPIEPQTAHDGLAFVALGLGKLIVEGGHVLSFSPKYPEVIHQFGTIENILQTSQTIFYALDLKNPTPNLTANEDETLVKLNLSDAEVDGTLHPVGSVYSYENERLYDSVYRKGIRVVTFAQMLKYKTFPLAEILEKLLEIGKRSFGGPVEIEFAVNLPANPNEKSEMALLQIRPMVATLESINVDFDSLPQEDTICRSRQALGNGRITTIHDLIYVKPNTFSSLKTRDIATEIGMINAECLKQNRHYILIGPGRWGSSDHSLGIPVEWSQISGARVLVEAGLSNYNIEPSQGTHFFQNITSLGIGYFSVNYNHPIDYVAWDWLDQQPAKKETTYLRWISFPEACPTYLDGKQSWGVILKPGQSIENQLETL
ncbi:MAG: response regulator [Gemmatimonadetes bacterium]|nr:MAG: response regulator [Gemmatimonadota bacterium]